jgi:hypothetical protein
VCFTFDVNSALFHSNLAVVLDFVLVSATVFAEAVRRSHQHFGSSSLLLTFVFYQLSTFNQAMDQDGYNRGPLQRLEEEHLNEEMNLLNVSVSTTSPSVTPNMASPASDSNDNVFVSPSKVPHVYTEKLILSLQVDPNTNPISTTRLGTVNSPARPSKRNRTNSSASSTSSETFALQPCLKSARQLSPSNSNNTVSFLLQNNNDQSGAAESDNTTAASSADNNGGAAGNDNGLLSSYKVHSMALSMWRSARNNKIAERKADLRANTIQELLENDVVPATFLGADKLPAYLMPRTWSLLSVNRGGPELN